MAQQQNSGYISLDISFGKPSWSGGGVGGGRRGQVRDGTCRKPSAEQRRVRERALNWDSAGAAGCDLGAGGRYGEDEGEQMQPCVGDMLPCCRLWLREHPCHVCE